MTKSTPDVPPEYFFYLQYHVVKQRELELGKVLEGMDLTISKWRILSTLNRMGRCSMGVVADFCAIDRTTLTRIMDQLEAVGYVARRADAKDRRQTMLDLTESGQAAYDAAVAAVVRFNRKALHGVDAGELEVLERLLRKVVHNVIDDQAWAESILRFEEVGPR
jgi:DNA-binding MarR family transcriptional regulator